MEGHKTSNSPEVQDVLKESGTGDEDAAAASLWTASANGLVKLRIDATCSQKPITVHDMFLESLEKYGSLNAMASRKDGRWEKITFLEYYNLSRKAAKSFLKLGLERFHAVAILGFNSAEWFILAVGTIFAGGIVTGIYTTNSPEACQYIAHDCRANIIVVDNQKQLDKIMQIWHQLPHLKAVVMYRDPMSEKHPNLYAMDEFMALGNQVLDEDLDAIIHSQKPNQCCVLIYTSGTTGKPKGAMLSHDNGGLVDILKEALPTSHMGVPRVWEKIMEKIKEISSQSGFLKKKMLSWAMSVSLERNLSGSNSDLKPFRMRLADYLVLAKIRQALGFSQCQKHFSGAAPLPAEVMRFFLGLNIPLYEAYGMSETTGPHCMSGPYVYQRHSCGKAVPGCKVKLVNVDTEGNGEICFWGRTVFMGYLNMENKIKEAIDEDGWLHSGDLGKIDRDDFIYVTGRIKEILITAGGENVPPVPIEDAVKKELPLLSNTMLIGDRKKFLSMLLTLKCVLDPDTSEPTDRLTQEARDFCEKVGSRATKVSKIVRKRDPAVYRAIQEGIDRVNERAVANVQRVQKWAVLEKDFSIVGGEFGPTMKLRRQAVIEKYRDEIEAFYKD
ncbi:long-chain-fatty-acid--CoA ligase ACSBG1 isoform X3 [Sphaerodactylus townsendi]|uniref:long-chain-fatty-acid--CoA ligase ACSBG1 isoform X3 n=1 Tax=Sphaerodactylus townsendi TaxID=933632 RepID=UPI002026B4E8|nr:long-chain-fatty-acid--CoA ligase ACSBG1 isoform X3 [Sphaerodactylus townsendi]